MPDTLYAAGQGYVPDRKKRWGNCEVMRRGSEKIIISMGENGVWMYWNATEQGDAGNIIDFVQKRQRIDLGSVRRELRPWLDGSASVPQNRAGEFDQPLLPITKEKADMYAKLALMQTVSGSSYLNRVRSIPERVTADPRFAGRIYQDQRSNAVFPHYDLEGVCGAEIKNTNFTGFTPGGSKGLWCSRTTPEDTSLVIGEAAIDVLSFAALHPDLHTRYVSTGGALNDDVRVAGKMLRFYTLRNLESPKPPKINVLRDISDEFSKAHSGRICASGFPVSGIKVSFTRGLTGK